MSVYIEDEIPSVTKLNQKSQTIQASSPVLPTAGQLWYDTANGQKQYDGSSWIGMKFGGDVYVQANKILTTGYQIFEATTANSIVAPVIEPQGTTADGALVIKPAEHGTNFYNSYIYIRNRGNITGNGQELRVGITANEVVIDSQRTLNTVPYIPMKIRMAGNDIITLNIDNSINANSRLWSNFKLGGNMDANAFAINAIAASYMDSNTGDKLSLLDARLGLTSMYGLGVETSALYYKTGGVHRWYVTANADSGASDKMELGSSTLVVNVDISMGAFKLKSTGSAITTGFYAQSSNGRSWILRTETGTNNYSDLKIVPIGIGSSTIRSSMSIFGTDFVADATNYERLLFQASDNAGTPSGYIINSSAGGTGSLRTITIQMGGVDILTFKTDNTVNANSRAWSNFVLGNNMDAGSNRLTKVSTIHFDTTNVDTDSTIMGNRSSTLSICATANGTVGQSISLRTSSVVTAGAGTPLTRLTISGGASTTNITISNANLQLNTNKFYMNANTVYMSYWGGVDSDIAIVRTDTTNNYSGLYIIPNGTPSSTVARLAVNMLDVGASNTNRSRIELLATATSGTPQQFALAVTNAGTGSLYPFKIQMSSNDIITFNTDNSVNANSRLWNNFKLGGGMDANSNNISNVSSIILANSNGANFSNDQSGSLDLGANNATAATLNVKPYVDFHFGLDGTTIQDFNIRIQNDADKTFTAFQSSGAKVFRLAGGGSGGFNFYEDAGVKFFFVKHDGTNAIIDVSSGSLVFGNTATIFRPYSDITQQLGGSANRWVGVYGQSILTNNIKTNDGVTAIAITDTTAAMNFNSRLVTNFKLGGLMDGGAQKIYDVVSIYMSSTAGDDPGTGFLAGLRTANLGIMSAADGTTAREIRFYTQNTITAGMANGVERLRVGAGVAQGSSLITSFEPFQFESYHDAKVISAPSNPASGYGRIYMKTTDANNDDPYIIHKVATAMTEERIATGMQGAGVLTYRQLKSNFINVNSTGYIPVSGFDNATTSINTAASDVQMICPVAGTIKNLYFECYQFGFTLATLTVTVQKNGVDTALTITCNTASTVFSDTTHSFTVAAGDLLNIKVVAGSSGTGTAGLFMAAIQYVK